MLMEKTYQEEGEGQGGKMFWGGAFGMKSAVRVSSLDALKKIFNQVRIDLKILFEKKNYDDSDEEYFSPQNSVDDGDEYYSPEE